MKSLFINPQTRRRPPGWSLEIRIRQVTENDLPALEWNGEYQHFRRIFADAYARAERGEAVLWIAEHPEKGLVGQLFVQLGLTRGSQAGIQPRAYVYGFRVRPEFRGAGIGTRLLQTTEADLRRRGYHYVSLNVGRDNIRARNLYERLGYRIAGPESGVWSYIDDKGRQCHVHEPAWRMEKEL